MSVCNSVVRLIDYLCEYGICLPVLHKTQSQKNFSYKAFKLIAKGECLVRCVLTAGSNKQQACAALKPNS